MQRTFKIYEAAFAFLSICPGVMDPLEFSDRYVDRLAANPAWTPDEVAEVQRLILRRLGEENAGEFPEE